MVRRSRMVTALVALAALASTVAAAPAASARSAPTVRTVPIPTPPRARGATYVGPGSCPNLRWCAVAEDTRLVGGGQYYRSFFAVYRAGTDGPQWAMTKAMSPKGFPLSSVDELSCPRAGSCVAIGTGANFHDESQNLAWTYAHGTWSVRQLPHVDPGRPTDHRDLSCGGASCAFIARFGDGYKRRAYFFVSHDGRWTATSPPAVPGLDADYPLRIGDAGCDPQGRCFVTGLYRSSSHVVRPALWESVAGRAWHSVPVPVPAGATWTRFTTLTCAPGCAAAGDFRRSSAVGGLVVTWLGAGARTRVVDHAHPRASIAVAACSQPTTCVAYGLEGRRFAWFERDGGPYAAVADPFPALGPYRKSGVIPAAACPHGACVAAAGTGSTTYALAELSGASWTETSVPIEGHGGLGLQCPSAGHCATADGEDLQFVTFPR